MLILASASPRRQELLRLIASDFAVITKDTGEEVAPFLSPPEVVRELSLRKALAVAADYQRDIVIGADTVVAVDDQILGKPANAAQAVTMLELLSGREHAVYTGVAICTPRARRILCEETRVTFRTLDAREIRAYVATGEPFDKAGGYGIQGGAALFVSCICGEYTNVVGLPVCALSQALRALPDSIWI